MLRFWWRLRRASDHHLRCIRTPLSVSLAVPWRPEHAHRVTEGIDRRQGNNRLLLLLVVFSDRDGVGWSLEVVIRGNARRGWIYFEEDGDLGRILCVLFKTKIVYTNVWWRCGSVTILRLDLFFLWEILCELELWRITKRVTPHKNLTQLFSLLEDGNCVTKKYFELFVSNFRVGLLV